MREIEHEVTGDALFLLVVDAAADVVALRVDRPVDGTALPFHDGGGATCLYGKRLV